MATYPTPTELAGFLQKDLDTYSATQALALAAGDFATAADTAFSATTLTWTTQGGPGTDIQIPYRPVTAVSQVRLNGVVITGWTLRLNALWRSTGFGTWYAFPPDLVEVDLTYGYTADRIDAKLAMLEIAGGLYQRPDVLVSSEAIDDYRITYYSGTPIYPGRPWREVAADYRGIAVA
jgi:hypothetical protein